jgi:hypothetical protein
MTIGKNADSWVVYPVMDSCETLFLVSTSLRTTARAGEALERLCNAKHPVAGAACPVKLAIVSLADARIQYNA